ncbi:GNAT family N-acetyltransferase [Lactobacillus sp. LL6]|uniref:GNAT family N-acetyltransferase n=1 Tax=Lactobacillus sp. LL6 TaxID=2596827 RepID=UPI00118632B3|nr:GNAT family N-acetyltransferase [Lactobacillus sp. LL6]TSO25816.1 GNAT family N-acetyltransferase [Lactobacillus sp. LL6]
MFIRKYQSNDCQKVIELFYDTVHTINARDYNKEQLFSWAPKEANLNKWNQSLMNNFCLVAEMDNQIVGFGDISKDGYLDHLFVHKDFQGQGIASNLCNKLESIPSKQITTHASITAKPFFEKRGYKVIKKQTVVRNKIELVNYVMRKNK